MSPFRQGRLFVISAPTGGGKTTVTQAVIKKLAPIAPISKVVTYTTRPPRPQEQNGVDYNFITESEFLALQKHGNFLETTVYDGYLYGSPKSILADMEGGRSFIIVTDRPGAKILKQLVPQAILIWITVLNNQTLAQRLQKRGALDHQSNQQRLAIAIQEMDEENREHFFTHHIMNDNLDDAVNALSQKVIQEIMPNK